jgi:hypothetical protein
MVPEYQRNTAWLLALLALPQLSPPSALAATAACATTQPIAAATQRRLQPIINGRHVQPRREEICTLLPRGSDCRARDAEMADDELLRDILRRSAP